MKKFCTYCRVSTVRQGESGLGLEAQLRSCEDYISKNDGQIISRFTDMESGRSRTRRGLLAAIDLCKQTGATLVIAKLDRLARDVEFVFTVYNTGVDIYIVDMPIINTVTLAIFAAVSQYERELTSTRTRDALRVARARGTKLGAHNSKWIERNSELETIERWQESGAAANMRSALTNENNIKAAKYVVDAYARLGGKWSVIAEELNRYGFKTSRGNDFQSRTAQRLYENRNRYGV